MHKKLIHFDTTFNANPTKNPYDTSLLPMVTPIKKIKSIALKAAELPLILQQYGNVQTTQTIPFSITYATPEYTKGTEAGLPYQWILPVYGFDASQLTSPATFDLVMNYPRFSPILTINVGINGDTPTSYDIPLPSTTNLVTLPDILKHINESISSHLPTGFPFSSLVFDYNTETDLVGIQFGLPNDNTLVVDTCTVSDCPLLTCLGSGHNDIVFSGYDVTYLPASPIDAGEVAMLFSNTPMQVVNPICIVLPKTANYTIRTVCDTIQTQLKQGLTQVKSVTQNNYDENTLTLFSVSCSYAFNPLQPFSSHIFLSLSSNDAVIQNNFTFALQPTMDKIATERQLNMPSYNFLTLLGCTGRESMQPSQTNQKQLTFSNSPQVSQIGTKTGTEMVTFPVENSKMDTSLGGLLSLLNGYVSQSVDSKESSYPFVFSFDDNSRICVSFPYAPPNAILKFPKITSLLTTLGFVGTETCANNTMLFLKCPIAKPSGKLETFSDSIVIPSVQLSYGNMTQLLGNINTAFRNYLNTFPDYQGIFPTLTKPTYAKSSIANFSIQFQTDAFGKAEVVFGANKKGTGPMPLPVPAQMDVPIKTTEPQLQTQNTYINLFDGTINSVNPYVLSFSPSPLLTLLGFTANPPVAYDDIGQQVIKFTKPYQLSINTYVNLYIQNLPISTTNASGLNSTFKIPLSYSNQVLNVSNIIGNQTLNTYFFDEQNSFPQVIEISDYNYVMDKLKISVYDRTGNILNAIPLDWSFTLEIAFDT